jgi:hypothetical protein
MPETDFHHPASGRCAAAEAEELAHAASGLVSAYGYRLADRNPFVPLAREMTEADRTVHRCASHDPRSRPGGVGLPPVPAGPAAGRSEAAESWTTHNLLLDWGRSGTCTGTRQAMNAAIGGAETRFLKTSRVLAHLAGGRADLTWDKRLRELTRPAVLILDDFGMRELTAAQADDLYELITERSGRSLILTSNRAPRLTGTPCSPTRSSPPLLDRLINTSHQVFMNGPSYRPNKRSGRVVPTPKEDIR